MHATTADTKTNIAQAFCAHDHKYTFTLATSTSTSQIQKVLFFLSRQVRSLNGSHQTIFGHAVVGDEILDQQYEWLFPGASLALAMIAAVFLADCAASYFAVVVQFPFVPTGFSRPVARVIQNGHVFVIAQH